MLARPFILAGSVAASLLVVFACSDDATTPVTNDVNGDWIFSERLQGPSIGLVCNDTAHVRVAQDGEAFSVTGVQFGTCRLSSGEEFPNEGTVTVTDGRIRGDASVTFSFAGCSYTGRIEEGDQRATGSGSCAIDTGLGTIAATSAWTMRKGDFRPPTVSAALDGLPVTHGDTLTVTVQAGDNTALARLGTKVSWQRALDVECLTDVPAESDSGQVSGTSASRTGLHVVPPCTAGAVVQVFAVDTAGRRTEMEFEEIPVELPFSDVDGTLGDTLYTLGDTVTVDVSATNAHGLGWIGYSWNHADSNGRDSVAVVGTDASATFRFVIPESDYPHLIYMDVFARHRMGWRTQAEIESARTTDAMIVPLQSLTLPGSFVDAAYDPGADRLYLLDAVEAQLYEVDLTSLSLGTTHALPFAGRSLDLTLGNDSVLVALRDMMAVASVPVNGGPVTTLALAPPDTMSIYDARWIRVAAHGRALVGVGSGTQGVVLDLDPGSGAQSVRLESVPGDARSERTPDRSRLLFVGYGSPVTTRLYLSATDEFLDEQAGIVMGGTASADDAATAWLVGRQLLTIGMEPIHTLTDPSVDWGPSTLAPDGARAWVGRLDGLVEFEAGNGERTRALWLPATPDWVRALSGGRLLAASGNRLFLLTLD